MSYCRHTNGCDLYCYSSVNGGYVTIVASRRLKPGARLPKSFGSSSLATAAYLQSMGDWFERHQVPINSPSAGQHFEDPDLRSFRARLTMLREEGLRFPDTVLLRVDNELLEENSPWC